MNIIDYRYDECGLDNVILKGLRVMKADDGEEVITIPNIGQLHRVLTLAVACKEGGLEPKELRFLRTEMGLTQAQLAALVGKEVQAIARWEKGANPTDKSAEIVIRARAMQQAAESALPPMEQLAEWTMSTAEERPFLIDARNPDQYERIAA